MTYEYYCEPCDHTYDVIKRASEYNSRELCGRCGGIATRSIVPRRIHLSGTAVIDAEFNPGLGCVVKNKNHRIELAKQKGLIEIGNEPVESFHKHYEAERRERREKAYESATKGWVGVE